ncbi:sentrin-specific protease 1-like isoform X3 [Daphnia pulicaria]|nr:sentrin-specific protease 1-like isoform X3 [Daphnia pulicaria]
MSGVPHDTENHIQSMAYSSQKTKKDLETKETNMYKFFKGSNLQTSTPIGSPIPVDAQLLKEIPRGNQNQKDLKSGTQKNKMELNQPLSSTGPVEAGSSLSQLERLMVDRLGSTALSVKPKAKALHKSESTPTFTFTPMATTITTSSKKTEFSSSIHSKIPFKQNTQDFTKRVSNGGVQKNNYRPLMQKLYGSPKQHKALKSSILNNHSHSLAIQNCVRMDEKLSYKALISQFTTKVPSGRFSLTSLASTSSCQNSSAILQEKIGSNEAKSIQAQLKASSFVIDLVNESNSFQKAPIASPINRSPVKSAVRINSLEEALAQSPQYDCRFISEIKSRFNKKERDRQRLRDEEAIRCKVLAENREEWEKDLENRVRKQLEIAIRPVIEEPEVEEVVILPEISSDMHNVIEKAWGGHSENEVLCDAFSLTITRRDVKTLSGLNWLNDQVINFYLTLVMERSSSGDWPKAYAFNTFFYPKLMSSGHGGLKRWTRKVDLFQQDIILIPVHLGLHWCLATVCPKEQAIRYYDSMGGRNQDCLNGLKRYMEAESMDKKKTSLDTSKWTLECIEDIPQQMNGSDCGMFTCKYAEYLSRKAKITFAQKDMPYFRKRMVYEIITQKLINP